jgi:hypothetical protein
MKKKGPRAIPEFGRAAKQGKGSGEQAVPQSDRRPAPAQPRPMVKPNTMPTKSGQRGR